MKQDNGPTYYTEPYGPGDAYKRKTDRRNRTYKPELASGVAILSDVLHQLFDSQAYQTEEAVDAGIGFIQHVLREDSLTAKHVDSVNRALETTKQADIPVIDNSYSTIADRWQGSKDLVVEDLETPEGQERVRSQLEQTANTLYQTKEQQSRNLEMASDISEVGSYGAALATVALVGVAAYQKLSDQ